MIAGVSRTHAAAPPALARGGGDHGSPGQAGRWRAGRV